LAVVVFDYAGWALRYPELAYISQPLAQAYFSEAGLYCDNTASSPITDDAPGGQRAMFLGMLTAHIATLNSPSAAGIPASPLVGRISDATEGSVSVRTQNDYPPGTVQWFQSTRYGAAFWAASAVFRTMQYFPRPRGPRRFPGYF
jgi:Protein of unknown function (DUF4054)